MGDRVFWVEVEGLVGRGKVWVSEGLSRLQWRRREGREGGEGGREGRGGGREEGREEGGREGKIHV